MDLHSRAFALYALFAVALSARLLVIDASSGAVRSRSKTTPNREDAGTVAKGAAVVDADPDEVARVMRAHRNAGANVVPFLVLMFVYVALGATAGWVLILCGVFTAMRLAHAVVYIRALQPWRTLSFVVGQLCNAVAAVQIVRAALALV
jgi:uncharacterized membrane protein YecN with MAPEG domain